MESTLKQRYAQAMPKVDFSAVFMMQHKEISLHMRRSGLQPIQTVQDQGVMCTVIHEGGLGYCATSDRSTSGLRAAFKQASHWAKLYASSPLCVIDHEIFKSVNGYYQTPVAQDWHALSDADRIGLLQEECEQMKQAPKIVDCGAQLWSQVYTTHYLNSNGSEVSQDIARLVANTYATAFDNGEAQTRSLGMPSQQGGAEVLARVGYLGSGKWIAEEAQALLAAPDCPNDTRDVLLAPSQMILQIHESIGHPLELDRILGDERNYAGRSFVSTDMFGNYQYGSDLLNVSFDPSLAHQFANYQFDDEGTQAEKVLVIENGILKRPLGGMLSGFRANMPHLANARSESWYRPPIDRISNLNVEAGPHEFADMIQQTEKGIYMKTNRSWSIDDSRNKFQFGCEWAQLIENGELTTLVKNPNYRGISANFWRNLKMVGNADSREVHGSPYCGKGELNQMIGVGHTAPPCLFEQIDVFGAGA